MQLAYDSNSIRTEMKRFFDRLVGFSSLCKALGELSGVVANAVDEGFPPPLMLAVKNAKRLLKKMHQHFPRRYFVYPTEDSEVAIGTQRKPRRGVLLLCDSQGGGMFFVSIDGRSRHKIYGDVSNLPDEFMFDALDKLGS